MIAVPIALVLFGYWVLYGGLKRVSLAEAWACTPQPRATGTPQSGISQNLIPSGTDCTVRPGDTRIPVPGTNTYLIWRPVPLPFGGGIAAQVNGQLLGPCGG